MIPQELIEAAQVRERDVDLGRNGRAGECRRGGGRRRDRSQDLRPASDGLGADQIGLHT